MSAPEISFPAAIAWTGYLALVAALLWRLNRRRPLKEVSPFDGATAHPSTLPVTVDLAGLERELAKDVELLPMGAPESLSAAL